MQTQSHSTSTTHKRTFTVAAAGLIALAAGAASAQLVSGGTPRDRVILLSGSLIEATTLEAEPSAGSAGTEELAARSLAMDTYTPSTGSDNHSTQDDSPALFQTFPEGPLTVNNATGPSRRPSGGLNGGGIGTGFTNGSGSGFGSGFGSVPTPGAATVLALAGLAASRRLRR